MGRFKSIGGLLLAVILVLAFWAALFWLSNLGGQSCDPNAYDHCDQVSAPGPGGR